MVTFEIIYEKINEYFNQLYRNIYLKLLGFNYSLESENRSYSSIKINVDRNFSLSIGKKHMSGLGFNIEIHNENNIFYVHIQNHLFGNIIFEINKCENINQIKEYFFSLEDKIIEYIHSIKYISSKEIFEYINIRLINLYRYFNNISENSKFEYSIVCRDNLECFDTYYMIHHYHCVDIIIEVDNNLEDFVSINIEMFADSETSEYDNEDDIIISSSKIILDKNIPNLK